VKVNQSLAATPEKRRTNNIKKNLSKEKNKKKFHDEILSLENLPQKICNAANSVAGPILLARV
jgi:hypothetical protein